jgi:two-component system, LytTR family, response regulator
MKIRTVVADDQPLARMRLLALLSEEQDVEVVATVGSGPEAVEALRHSAPDLIFLDVQMPGMDGLAVVEAIGADRMPATVFVTAYDEYAVQAFEIHAVDYLLKPFGRSRLQKALARVRTRLEADRAGAVAARLLAVVDEFRNPAAPGERLIVRSGGRVTFVDVEQIDFVEAEGNYVRIHAAGESHLVRETMARLQSRLDPARFFRIHRSRLVNVTRIKALRLGAGGDYDVVLHDGRHLGLSRLYKDALQERLARGTPAPGL